MPSLFRTISNWGQWRFVRWEFWRLQFWPVAGLLMLAYKATEAGMDGNPQAMRQSWSLPAPHGLVAARLECYRGYEAVEKADGREGRITITARPKLVPNRHHGPEPDGKEKRPEEWPFAWALAWQGGEVVLTVEGEVQGPSYRYFLEDVEMHLPPGVELSKRVTELKKLP